MLKPIISQKCSNNLHLKLLKNFKKLIIFNCQINDLSLYKIKEESPGSTKTQCQLTTGKGDFRESATEPILV